LYDAEYVGRIGVWISGECVDVIDVRNKATPPKETFDGASGT
jgi:hypothetical protein